MPKDFKDYFERTKRTYFYRIKTVSPIGEFGSTEDQKADAIARLEVIERVLLRYDPISMSPVRKTIIQSMPVDFPNVQNREVYIVDVVCGLPVSPQTLRMQIKQATDIPEEFLAVHGECDPQEIEMETADALISIADEAKEKKLTPASLLSDTGYQDGVTKSEELYGDQYNGSFLAYLNSVRTDEIPTPEDIDTADFNANIDGAPTAHPDVAVPEKSEEKVVRRTYRDEDGKLYTLTRVLDMRDDIND